MLNLITDQRPGEPDLLTHVKHKPFELRSLAGNELAQFPAPVSGWTNEQLLAIAVNHEHLTQDGADGYLGGQWVGSTEV